MARGIVPVSTAINLTLVLDKTSTGKYCQAKIYNSSDTLVDTVNLTEEAAIGEGVYQASWTTPSSAADLYIIYKVFSDSGHTTLDTTIPRHAEETLYVTSVVSLSSATPYTHTDTIINSLTSAPIDGANVYIYTDAAYSNQVTSAVTNVLGVYSVTLDAAGTYYRKIVATGYLFANSSITVT